GSLTVRRTTISGNLATNRASSSVAGLYSGPTGMLDISNSTFANNTANTQGGGLTLAGTSTATITNVTFAANSASTGAAFMSSTSGLVTITNTIIGSNTDTGPSGTACYFFGGPPTAGSGGGNIDAGTSCGLTTGAGDLQSTDPQLGPLQDNGGPTKTM